MADYEEYRPSKIVSVLQSIKAIATTTPKTYHWRDDASGPKLTNCKMPGWRIFAAVPCVAVVEATREAGNVRTGICMMLDELMLLCSNGDQPRPSDRR